MPSNIRAAVHWREGTVYAGEEIVCLITFKNVATPPEQDGQKDSAPITQANGYMYPRGGRRSHTPSVAHSRQSSVAQTRAPSVTSARGVPQTRGHRPSLSLNVVSAPSRAGLHSAPIQGKSRGSAMRLTNAHARSLSIISLGASPTSEGQAPPPGASAKRPLRGHGRSASLQYPLRQTSQASPALGIGSPRQPSPLYESTTPPALPESQGQQLRVRPQRRKPGILTANNTPQLDRQPSVVQSPETAGFNPGFSFPAKPVGPKSPSPQSPKPSRNPSNMPSTQPRAFSPRPPEGWSGALGNLNPISRVMSEPSTADTPRTSSEFYSMSNHSNETFTSEIPSQYQQNGRLLPKPTHSRQPSRSRQQSKPAQPETLMMGYVQTMGHFTLDGSLVNAAPFEEVKRKAVQSGGGVVGIERSSRSSGMFGAFSWGNIGESLSGLLGSDEMSSIAQMKATAGSRAVPLLSTPQSLLFVDLRLAPGESRSYSYRFALPRGLPPSHRGRALKVDYHLAIGVQRPGDQAVKHVEVPFRVLGSYNVRGETLGHDLMSPYILLQDAAHTASIAPDSSSPSHYPTFAVRPTSSNMKTPQQGLEDFLRYTERLLEQPKDAHGALLSPTSPRDHQPSLSRQQSLADQPPGSVKEVIDFAILQANHVNQSGKHNHSEAQSVNRFNIARSGQPVAVLTLLRPAYRCGEAVIGTIDFTAPGLDSNLPSQAPTYAVLVELESAERVDPSLALRSSSSINRVTRKVHAAAYENAIFARQVSFNLTVPTTATPTFETTGVSLVWRLRIEFTTQQQAQGLGIEGEGPSGDEELLEEVGSDERGTTLIAKERLLAETFEIAVPLNVYGVPGVDGMTIESEALVI